MGQKYTLFKASLEGLDDKPRWYTIITAYNYEQKVTNDLKKMAASPEFKDLVVDAFSGSKITEELYTVKSGEIKVKNKTDKVFMNYVFVKSTMDAKMWNTLMNITGVSGILCVAGRPVYTDDNKIEETRAMLSPILITKEQYLEFKNDLIKKGVKVLNNTKLDKRFEILDGVSNEK